LKRLFLPYYYELDMKKRKKRSVNLKSASDILPTGIQENRFTFRVNKQRDIAFRNG